MTPELLRERLHAAVAPVVPSPASYAWLRASIDRRRRARTRLVYGGVAAATLVVVGVAAAVALPGDPVPVPPAASETPSPSAPAPAPTPTPSPTATPSSTPTTTSSRTPLLPPGPPNVVVATELGDVDGDGTADRVLLIESTSDRTSAAWRFGVRALMSEAGSRIFWYDFGEAMNEGQALGPVADLNGDGRAEIAVSPGGTAFGRGYDLLTLSGSSLAKVTGAALNAEQRPDAVYGWGCERGLVYTAAGTSDDGGRTFTGTRTYYRLPHHRLRDPRLAEVERQTDRWTGTNAPPQYRADAACPA